jgi:hypothetical protein
VYKDYRIVAVTPAGRKPYLEILSKYIARDSHIIDEWQLWLNTLNNDDIAYCERLRASYSFIKTYSLTGRWAGNHSIHRFFPNCVDPKTIYIRFDDDIVWIERKAITSLLDFRINNPQYFLVFPNIVNNSLMSHIHQRHGIFHTDKGICDYAVMDKVGWKRGDVAQMIHEQLLDDLANGGIEKYKFDRWVLYFYERFSINSFAFFGKDFAEFGGRVDPDEENWLSRIKPSRIARMNCVCGSAIISHYAYHTQRPFLDGTDILVRYKRLSEGRSFKKEPKEIEKDRLTAQSIKVSILSPQPLMSKIQPDVTIAVVPDKMEYSFAEQQQGCKVVSIAPHKCEHTINLDLLKLRVWSKKNNCLLKSHGNVNQFPMLSMVSDSVILTSGTADIYSPRPYKHKLPVMPNYQEVDVTGGTPLTDFMRQVKSEVTNKEVIDAFKKSKIFVRQSTFNLFESLRDDLPKNCIWCETRFDHDPRFDNSEAIQKIKDYDFELPVFGLDKGFTFQKSILETVRHHYMGIQVLCSLLSNVYFLCLRGSSNLFSILPAKCICYSDSYLEDVITAYLDHRHEECVRQFEPNKILLKELLVARYGNVASAAWVEPWQHPQIDNMLKNSKEMIAAMGGIKVDVVYEQ